MTDKCIIQRFSEKSAALTALSALKLCKHCEIVKNAFSAHYTERLQNIHFHAVNIIDAITQFLPDDNNDKARMISDVADMRERNGFNFQPIEQ